MEYRFKSDAWKELTPSQKVRRCHLMAEEARALAERAAASPKLRLAYMRIAENWLKLADDTRELSVSPATAEPRRPRLKASDAQAIAEFLNGGGRIVKLKDSVTATEQEVIEFLATCGVAVKNFQDSMKGYWCNGRSHSMSALVRLANEYRRAQKLAPFAVRLSPAARKR